MIFSAKHILPQLAYLSYELDFELLITFWLEGMKVIMIKGNWNDRKYFPIIGKINYINSVEINTSLVMMRE